MGKKGYDHRLLACVQRGKCVEGLELPVINPAENVVEGRINARRKPRKRTAKKAEFSEDERISDEQLVELFLKRPKSGKKIGNEVINFSGKQENSLDAALTMLRNKARAREVNKLGAELEDIKDRMVNVLDDYDDLLTISPYAGPLEMEIGRILEIDGVESWRNSVKNLINGYAKRCKEREEVLEDVYQYYSDDEEEEAPSIATDDIEEVERAGAEISGYLESMQMKARKLNFLHYSMLKSNSGSRSQDLGIKIHREMDLQRKVVDKFKDFVKVSNERKTKANAWKYAATEIVGLLKSVREEGTFKMHEIEKSFRKLLSAFNAQTEQLESVSVDLRKQRQVATIAEEEKRTIQDDNILLQDQLETFRKELKASQKTSERLKNRLSAHLDDIDDEDLYKPVPADDEEQKDIIYIKRVRKIKSKLEELETENARLQSENKLLQENTEELRTSAAEAMKVAKNRRNSSSQNNFAPHKSGRCPNCTVLRKNFQDIAIELTEEKERVRSLENELADDQLQIQMNNQELAQLRAQNSKLVQMSQKLESGGPSAISLQSSQSLISAQPSFCPPEVSSDQLSSADESGYASHEISSLELKNFKTRLSRVEERQNPMVDSMTQTFDEFEAQHKFTQVEMEYPTEENAFGKVNSEQQENMRDLNRMAKNKEFDENFTDTLDNQIEMICKNIVCLTGLANVIRSRPSSPSESAEDIPRDTEYLENADKKIAIDENQEQVTEPDNSESAERNSPILLPLPEEGARPQVSIVNLTLDVADEPLADKQETTHVPVFSIENVAPVNKQNFTPVIVESSLPDVKASITALRNEIHNIKDNRAMDLEEALSDLRRDEEEFTLEHWKPNMRIHKASQAAFIVYSLKHFAEKSWKHFDAGTRKLLHHNRLNDEQKVNQHVKLMANHAFKILEVIGVSIGELSKFAKHDYVEETHSLPMIAIDAKSNHSGTKLITQKSGIWLPMIAINADDDHDNVVNNNSSRGNLEPRAAENTRASQSNKQGENAKHQTLPLINERKTETASKRPKEFLGIGGHQLMASKSQSENIYDKNLPKKATDVRRSPKRKLSCVPQPKGNFRTSRILGKNKKLVELLSKSGKSMNEINAILGLNQASSDEQPVSSRRDSIQVNKGKQLGLKSTGLSSKPIALPKIVENGQSLLQKSSNDKQTHQNFDLKEVLSATSIHPLELSQKKSRILALGNSFSPRLSIAPTLPSVFGKETTNFSAPTGPNSEVVSPRKNPPTTVRKHINGRFQLPTVSKSSAAGARGKNGKLQPFNIMGQNNQAVLQDNALAQAELSTNMKRQSVSGPQHAHNLRESLVEHRKQRRVSYAVHNQEQSSVKLPKLAINRQL